MRGNREITCFEPALDSGKCKFHDEFYLNEHTQSEIHDELCKKIDDACKNETILECVGYNIPEINLESKKFVKSVFFSHSNFVGDVIFDHSEFYSFANFFNCTFNKEINCNNVLFKEKVDFSSNRFNDNVYFESSICDDNADFSSSEFKEKVSFLTTEFTNVDFSNVVFSESVSFVRTEFKNKTWFTNTIFNNEVKFNRMRFLDEVSFSYALFKKFAHFRNSIFFKPNLVTFDTDLSHVSFLGTDISRIRFDNQVKWNIESEPTNKFHKFIYRIKNRNNKFVIYDEWLLENNQEPSLQLEDVMDVYRNLRENHDYYLKYETAGEFFVREMELKRKYKKNKNSSRKTISRECHEKLFSLYQYYHIISQYGHSICRPMFVSIPILSIFIALFCIENLTDPDFANLPSQKIFYDALFRSITSFFPFYSLDKDTNYLDILLRIILLPISGAFFISLKRKLERKFRH
ncbi:pentapeptide repeat-containing protein [Nitrosopumilus sp.]|uniref:pentapeptide repeat-containing protein n=1 Tax=Nitrosopumilus sp. TaxID=2024843 RepID=UPI003D097B19